MKNYSWIKTGLLCLVILSGFSVFKAMEIRAAMAFGESFPEHSETVQSVLAKNEPYTQTIRVMGEVHASKKVTLMSELPGRIEKVGFTSGEHVKKNQVLLQLDTSEQAALLASANARLTLAKSILKRSQKLLVRKAVSQEQLDKAVADVATVQAEIAQLNAVVRKKTIRAPFSGVTGLHQFETGQFILDNVEITHLVAHTGDLWVDFSLPEFYPILEKSSQVSVFSLDGEDVLPGRILASSSQIADATRSIKYRATLSNSVLMDGVSVRVAVPVAASKAMIELPVTALRRDHLGSYVFQLIEDEKTQAFRAKRLNVDVAAKKELTVLIAKGIDIGQRIATDGAFKLYGGILTYSEKTQG